MLVVKGQVRFHGRGGLGAVEHTRWRKKITSSRSRVRKRKEGHHQVRKLTIEKVNLVIWVNASERTVKEGRGKTPFWFQESIGRNEKANEKFSLSQDLTLVKIERIVSTWTTKNE